jgi:hypothetical protein
MARQGEGFVVVLWDEEAAKSKSVRDVFTYRNLLGLVCGEPSEL